MPGNLLSLKEYAARSIIRCIGYELYTSIHYNTAYNTATSVLSKQRKDDINRILRDIHSVLATNTCKQVCNVITLERSAIRIQRMWRRTRTPVMQQLVAGTIYNSGVCHYKLGYTSFTLTCNNHCYMDFVDPYAIEKVSFENNRMDVVRIQVDRHKIRHCCNRHLLVNLRTEVVTWHDIPVNYPKKEDMHVVVPPEYITVRIITVPPSIVNQL